jgi:BASS family bile acid:Na+ symporter
MTLASIILLALKVSIILSVFALGLKAAFSDVTFLFRHPRHFLRAFLSMKVLMPLIGLVMATRLDLHPAVRIALVVISVSPIPPVLPRKALKAGGKENYTIGLLVAMGLISIITIPITLEILGWLSGVPLSMRFAPVAVLVLVSIIAPLLAGVVFHKIAPTFADRLARPIGLVAIVLLVLSALAILISAAPAVWSLIGNGTVLSLAVFALCGFIIGHLLGGPEPDDRPVLGLATASRHPGIALAIAAANFPDQKLAAPAVLLYLVLTILLSALYLAWVKRRQSASTSAEEINKPAPA